MDSIDNALSDAGLKRVRLTELLDIYGGLLSDKQRQAMELWCDEDLSLSEIAEICGITRAGAHDRLVKSCAIIENAEKRLGLLSLSGRLQPAADGIKQAAEKIAAAAESEEIRSLAEEIISLSTEIGAQE